MKIYYTLQGTHYHCRVFFNGLSGTLVVGEKEWREFQASFHDNVRWIPEAD